MFSEGSVGDAGGPGDSRLHRDMGMFVWAALTRDAKSEILQGQRLPRGILIPAQGCGKEDSVQWGEVLLTEQLGSTGLLRHIGDKALSLWLLHLSCQKMFP